MRLCDRAAVVFTALGWFLVGSLAPGPVWAATSPADETAIPIESALEGTPLIPEDAPESAAPNLNLEAASEPAQAASLEAVSRRRAERHLPIWARKPAQFGVQLDLSAAALGDPVFPDGLRGTKIRGLAIAPEYQPLFLQRFGVVGIGPVLTGYFSTRPGGVVASNALINDIRGLWSWGAQIRYQAKFNRQQVLAPYVSAGIQQLRYGIVGADPGEQGPGGRFFFSTFSLGGMFLLNVLERSAADQMFLDIGIKQSYLVAELRFFSGSDDNILVDGSTLYFGLRFEF